METPVEILFRGIKSIVIDCESETLGTIDIIERERDILEKVKELEKQCIIDAYLAGLNSPTNGIKEVSFDSIFLDVINNELANRYYDERYINSMSLTNNCGDYIQEDKSVILKELPCETNSKDYIHDFDGTIVHDSLNKRLASISCSL